MRRNQAAQPPNIIVDTKSGGNSASDLVSKSVVACSGNLPFLLCNFLALVFGLTPVEFAIGNGNQFLHELFKALALLPYFNMPIFSEKK